MCSSNENTWKKWMNEWNEKDGMELESNKYWMRKSTKKKIPKPKQRKILSFLPLSVPPLSGVGWQRLRCTTLHFGLFNSQSKCGKDNETSLRIANKSSEDGTRKSEQVYWTTNRSNASAMQNPYKLVKMQKINLLANGIKEEQIYIIGLTVLFSLILGPYYPIASFNPNGR